MILNIIGKVCNCLSIVIAIPIHIYKGLALRKYDLQNKLFEIRECSLCECKPDVLQLCLIV